MEKVYKADKSRLLLDVVFHSHYLPLFQKLSLDGAICSDQLLLLRSNDIIRS